MKLSYREEGATLILLLDGELDEYSADRVRSQCDELITAKARRAVVVDLSRVAFMDSTGIGFLIGRYKRAQRLGLSFSVCSPNAAADKVLNISGLYSLIPKINAISR